VKGGQRKKMQKGPKSARVKDFALFAFVCVYMRASFSGFDGVASRCGLKLEMWSLLQKSPTKKDLF